jgi:hypothetical protein
MHYPVMEKAATFRTIMNEPYRDHPSEDSLERFLFNQSDEEELEIVETHFLACETCVTRLEALELNIAATKLALRTQQAEQTERLAQFDPSQAISGWKHWFSWLTVPRLSFAGAAIAACAVALTFVSVPSKVNLVAERGNETTTVSEWKPLHLHLQARELPAGPVTVEMFRNDGKQIWQGAATVTNEEIDVDVPRLMAAGDFLLQVYSPTAGNPVGDLVREYKLQSKPGL